MNASHYCFKFAIVICHDKSRELFTNWFNISLDVRNKERPLGCLVNVTLNYVVPVMTAAAINTLLAAIRLKHDTQGNLIHQLPLI